LAEEVGFLTVESRSKAAPAAASEAQRRSRTSCLGFGTPSAASCDPWEGPSTACYRTPSQHGRLLKLNYRDGKLPEAPQRPFNKTSMSKKSFLAQGDCEAVPSNSLGASARPAGSQIVPALRQAACQFIGCGLRQGLSAGDDLVSRGHAVAAGGYIVQNSRLSRNWKRRRRNRVLQMNFNKPQNATVYHATPRPALPIGKAHAMFDCSGPKYVRINRIGRISKSGPHMHEQCGTIVA
jgi:hypothetical protein